MALFRKAQAPKKGSPREEAKGAGRENVPAAYRGDVLRMAPRVLVRPHITEKAGRNAAFNQYVFVVGANATKPMIAQAVFEAYGVRPLRVQTVRIPGKRRRLGTTEGVISGYRKAIVTLPQGKTIEVLPK